MLDQLWSALVLMMALHGRWIASISTRASSSVILKTSNSRRFQSILKLLRTPQPFSFLLIVMKKYRKWMWTQAAVKVMHLWGNTNNISRVRRLVRIALLLTFVRHWNTSSGVTWMTRHSFCTAQKNKFMTCFISWLVSLGISCLVFVHPVLWLGTGPWPLHISRCQHFVYPEIHIITVTATASGRALVEKNSNHWPFLVPSTHPNMESLSFKSGPETRPSGPWNQFVVLRMGLCKTSGWRHNDSVKSYTVNSLNTEPPTDGKRQR